jgi:hypothetical protein
MLEVVCAFILGFLIGAGCEGAIKK